MKQVLWLASWYPNSLESFDGDFIQRHAEAVALFCKVHVIYVKKDKQLKTNEIATEIHDSVNLTQEIIYYNSMSTGIKLLDKFLSQRKFNEVYRNAFTEYFQISGKPDVVHVHVAMKAGITALWIKRKWRIPFIVSEHWTGYLPNADIRVDSFPALYQKWIKRILQKADAVTVVSDHLGKSMQDMLPKIKYEVIPNVVNTQIFYPGEKQLSTVTRFIHISNMNYQKNTEAIIEAASLLKDELKFTLNLYGPPNHEIENLIIEKGLQNQVFIKGEVVQDQLAEAIRQSDALILYSRFETFGCVIIEANACAVPVIVTDLEVFHELVEENVNGIFVEGENAAALAKKIKQFALQRNKFVGSAIAKETAEKFSYKSVGLLFNNLYNHIIN